MDAYDFTINLIESNTILDYETYTENAIKAILANDLTQNKFIDMLKDFKSFEGNNHKFCINFTGSWLKYALDGIHNKDQMNTHKLIRNILGEDFIEKERVGGTAHHQLSTEIYEKINWKEYLGNNIIEDRSPQRKYMIIKCNKQRSNNSWHEINMIIVRPKDLLDIMTTSKCVTEYRKYFITLAEIRRSYQETYLSWVIEQYKHAKLTLEQKVDKQLVQLDKQNENINYLRKQNDFIIHQNIQLTTKVDSIFNMMVSFMQATIPTWVGGSVMKNQLDILCKNHNPDKALTKLKVLYMVAFYVPYNRPVKRTREFDDKTIKFICKSNMIIYFCCTNFSDVGARIKQLDKRHGSEMYMLHPQAISLLSCEVNMERTFLEKLNIFPNKCVPSWSSKYKAFKVDIPYLQPDNIQTFLNNIALSGSNAKFQGYQMRMDTYNKSNKPKLDPKITVYLGNIDKGFFESSKPLAQLYLDSYITNDREVNDDGDHITYCKYTTFNKTKVPRSDLDNHEYHNPGYALRKIRTIIKAFDDRDVINEMVATGIVTKADVPAINAFAQYEGIDTSEFQFPDSDSE